MQKRLASYPVNGIMIAAVVTCGSIRCGRPPRTRARRMSLQFRAGRTRSRRCSGPHPAFASEGLWVLG